MDLKEYERIFKLNYSKLCAYATKYLDDVDAAEEVVQEIFVKFWEKREQLTIQKSVQAYFYNAVRNACFNQLRHFKVREEYKRHNEKEIVQTRHTVHDEYNALELETKIRDSIQALPERRRKIFLMSRFEGLKYKEIADQLKISIKTVENQMGSAIKYLRVELAEYLTLFLLLLLIG